MNFVDLFPQHHWWWLPVLTIRVRGWLWWMVGIVVPLNIPNAKCVASSTLWDVWGRRRACIGGCCRIRNPHPAPPPTTTVKSYSAASVNCGNCLEESSTKPKMNNNNDQQTNHIIHVPRLRCSFTWESIEWQPGEPLYSRSEIYGFYGFFAFLLRGEGREEVSG